MSVRAARLTPPGTGAIATIAVVGGAAWPMIHSLLRVRGTLSVTSQPPPGTVLLGHFGEPPGDEVVVTARPDVTNWFEIHCHGGPQVVDWILEHLANQGATIVSWTELESLASPDRFQKEAAVELTRALTLRTGNVLLDQYHGALSKSFRTIIDQIDGKNLDAARSLFERLISMCEVGRHITTPWRIAVCGPPNAGKSTLVNALAGYQRAIVTPTPGTTRDVVSTLLAFDGWPIEILDTAGLRTAADALEDAGIKLGLEAAKSADLVLWVTELGHWEPPPSEVTARYVAVENKSDLLNAAVDSRYVSPVDCVRLSALTGAGVEGLITTIVNRLVPTPPEPGEAVPFTPRLATAVESAWKLFQESEFRAARHSLAVLLSPEDSA